MKLVHGLFIENTVIVLRFYQHYHFSGEEKTHFIRRCMVHSLFYNQMLVRKIGSFYFITTIISKQPCKLLRLIIMMMEKRAVLLSGLRSHWTDDIDYHGVEVRGGGRLTHVETKPFLAYRLLITDTENF